jgi:hypothetical protein
LLRKGFSVERVTGIEPAWPAWKAGALPLSYTRMLAALDEPRPQPREFPAIRGDFERRAGQRLDYRARHGA